MKYSNNSVCPRPVVAGLPTVSHATYLALRSPYPTQYHSLCPRLPAVPGSPPVALDWPPFTVENDDVVVVK